MSEKRLDAKNRWRNVVVAFRMSPEEAQELNVKVSLSGLSKQDYIIQTRKVWFDVGYFNVVIYTVLY